MKLQLWNESDTTMSLRHIWSEEKLKCRVKSLWDVPLNCQQVIPIGCLCSIVCDTALACRIQFFDENFFTFQFVIGSTLVAQVFRGIYVLEKASYKLSKCKTVWKGAQIGNEWSGLQTGLLSTVSILDYAYFLCFLTVSCLLFVIPQWQPVTSSLLSLLHTTS